MKISMDMRTEHTILRSLESMNNDVQKFKTELKGNIKNAKLANNVIDEPYFNIPLDQVKIAQHFFCKKQVEIVQKIWNTLIFSLL